MERGQREWKLLLCSKSFVVNQLSLVKTNIQITQKNKASGWYGDRGCRSSSSQASELPELLFTTPYSQAWPGHAGLESLGVEPGNLYLKFFSRLKIIFLDWDIIYMQWNAKVLFDELWRIYTKLCNHSQELDIEHVQLPQKVICVFLFPEGTSFWFLSP